MTDYKTIVVAFNSLNELRELRIFETTERKEAKAFFNECKKYDMAFMNHAIHFGKTFMKGHVSEYSPVDATISEIASDIKIKKAQLENIEILYREKLIENFKKDHNCELGDLIRFSKRHDYMTLKVNDFSVYVNTDPYNKDCFKPMFSVYGYEVLKSTGKVGKRQHQIYIFESDADEITVIKSDKPPSV